MGARVEQVQLRQVRSKWGSVSTRGTLTLADDLLHLPRRLVAYVFCHDLLHRQVPNHNATYRPF